MKVAPETGRDQVAAVVIGRNEGARLERCLTSLQGEADRIVYVDSGSTDHSVAFARQIGAEVVELDMSQPFTAARARNAGFEALKPNLPDCVQFVDGDCGVEKGWIAKGIAFLETRPDVGMVTGWRREIAPEASIYNAMAQHEWHRPAGQITACGGDMLLRAEAFDALGGMNPQVIAAEDDELCVRLAKAGWVLWRLPEPMTLHDAAMTRFSEWWRRAVRTGHGFAQVGWLHPEYFVTERKRAWVYGAALPLLFLVGLEIEPLALLAALGWAWNYWRSAESLKREGMGRQRWHQALFLVLSKLPNVIGMLRFHARRRAGRAMRIIEYK
ncbi:glycosyltransferase [Mesobacterium pallidum]|uniref:glycosyltransferase n=1 Tax=Mesobacterium pallidum TaxID=2872037 RepID=UPI001EE1B27A|nr:glycosyltransferase [Mesobacterium pallidum]